MKWNFNTNNNNNEKVTGNGCVNKLGFATAV